MRVMTTRLLQAWMAFHTLVYRLSGGRLLGLGGRIVLLGTLGRRTGRLRTAPLFSVRDGAAYVVVGSYAGGPAHPAWYTNLLACPRALLNDGARTFPVAARVAEGADYERLWDLLCAANPAYAGYRGRTPRVLPIVCLEPAEPRR